MVLEPRFDVDPARWDPFVRGHPNNHLLQGSLWGEFKSRFGWEHERVALMDDEEIVAGAQVLYRPLPAGLGTLAYVPKGPVVDWEDEDQLKAVVDALGRQARERGAIGITLEPHRLDTSENRERMEGLGFHPSPLGSVQPRRTIMVDLTPDEDDILMAMKSKTRYNIRLAGRKGVTCRPAEKEDVSTFFEMMETTAERGEFDIHSRAYYETAFRLFVPEDRARLLFAEVEGEPVAALMVFALPPRSWYFYGASSNRHRDKMPTYLLQWEAMRWAKSLGCETYDLWGIPDEDEETLEDEFMERSDGLWGVYRFKRGFGGEVVRSVGAWDRIFAPIRYQLYRWALNLRRGE